MNDLERLRTDPNSWASVSFAAARTEDRGTYDANQGRRLRALLALQYDCRDSDRELVRFLFTHEILAAENDSFQGYCDGLELAAVLLARYRDPADVPLFARAKLANWDTFCGFTSRFVWVTCGAQTPEALQARDPELWERLLKAGGGDVEWSAAELETWWASINDEYPASEQDEPVLARYERALAFDDRQSARGYLEQWIAQEPESEAKTRQMQYEYTRLGDLRKAAEVVKGRLERSSEGWDRASALRDLVALYR